MSWIKYVELEHMVFTFAVIAVICACLTGIFRPIDYKLKDRVEKLEQRVLQLEATETKGN